MVLPTGTIFLKIVDLLKNKLGLMFLDESLHFVHEFGQIEVIINGFHVFLNRFEFFLENFMLLCASL